jgi:hypothetical protein
MPWWESHPALIRAVHMHDLFSVDTDLKGKFMVSRGKVLVGGLQRGKALVKRFKGLSEVFLRHRSI